MGAKTLLIAKAWQAKAQQRKHEALSGESATEVQWRNFVMNKASNKADCAESSSVKLSTLMKKHRETLLKPTNQAALLKSWHATSGALAKKEEKVRPALRSKIAMTHPYLAPFSGNNPTFTRQELMTILFTMFLAKMALGTLFMGGIDSNNISQRIMLAIIIAFCVIPVGFIMRYLFAYDVKAINRAADRKSKRSEERKKRAEKHMLQEKRKAAGTSNIAMKYAVMAKSQDVKEAPVDEDESTSSSESEDELDREEAARNVQSCAGKMGYVMAFIFAIMAIYLMLGVLALQTDEFAYKWLGVQGMTHFFKFFVDEPLKISLTYFFGEKIQKCFRLVDG